MLNTAIVLLVFGVGATLIPLGDMHHPLSSLAMAANAPRLDAESSRAASRRRSRPSATPRSPRATGSLVPAVEHDLPDITEIHRSGEHPIPEPTDLLAMIKQEDEEGDTDIMAAPTAERDRRNTGENQATLDTHPTDNSGFPPPGNIAGVRMVDIQNFNATLVSMSDLAQRLLNNVSRNAHQMHTRDLAMHMEIANTLTAAMTNLVEGSWEPTPE